ncbi:Rabankyrin-5 [Daphnia magna]|uniref:Rabankyrin-5 n=1 Tax=Daphnia magna TaxID=35525 RepID=A0A162SBW1_9CRUS|nr:Rabankyrin-5 [Daphnia magna]
MVSEGKDEAAKVSHHLSLLREEYNKLQARHAEVLKQLSASPGDHSNTFISRILKFIANLHLSQNLSDVRVKLATGSVPSHRFVLTARADTWLESNQNWESVTELDWSHLDQDIGEALLCWVYKDELKVPNNRFDFLICLLKAAGQYKLNDLINSCEQQLIPMVKVSNCVELFVRSEETGAETLRKFCASLMSNHWEDLNRENLAPLSAQSLYRLLEEHSSHPLQAAVRLGREDVVFLDLIKYTQQLPVRLNTVDPKGDIALDIALHLRYESLALCLVQHGANVDCVDPTGQRLLHKAILRKDEFACNFLLKHGALPTAVLSDSGYSPLHLLADWKSDTVAEVSRLLLKQGSGPNAVAEDGSTPLHLAVRSNNMVLIEILLGDSRTDCERQDKEGFVPLWHALQNPTDLSIADQLVTKCPSCVNAVSSVTGDPLLHMAAFAKLEQATFFLVNRKADVNALNRQGESPLHIASRSGMSNLVKKLLESGSDPNLQTPPPSLSMPVQAKVADESYNPFEDDEVDQSHEEESENIGLHSSIHLAVHGGFEDVITAFVEHTEKNKSTIDFDVRDSSGESTLCAALRLGRYSIAQLLLRGRASVNAMSPNDGYRLLHYFLLRGDEKAALFLLDNGADVHALTPAGESSLVLCIHKNLPSVLEALCRRGANMEEAPGDACPLWLALTCGNEDLASILVRYGVDTDHWEEGPDGTSQTLLHRALDASDETSACFLIRSGCDVNSPRRGGGSDNDSSTPLHLCAQWGLEQVAATLLEHGAEISPRDVEGKTPLHVAIEQHQAGLVQLLLRQPTIDLYAVDRTQKTPFATALLVKNNKAAAAVLEKDPSVAEQYDNKGRTLLHDIVLRGDLEGLLFLLSVRVNINSRTSDTAKLTPLHLAVQTGKDEMILRNLIVAGAGLNERGPRQQSALHMAAEREDGAALTSILLDAGADWSALDDCGNSALHTAARLCHVAVAQVLLTQSQIDAESRTMRGQNPLHLAAGSGRDASASLLSLFLQCMPQYPINAPDIDGNSPLLLAYMKGNVSLCKALVRAGACLAATNKSGVSIFNYQLATKQLLVRLLEQLNEEPPWAEHDYCMECGNKFGITTRKHHCRHCGRILCSKCSDQVVPILKFNLSKPVRVCLLCSQVLSSGVPSP